MKRRHIPFAELIGLSWGDVGDFGKAAFPYIHATGKAVASAFGASAAAQQLEDVEVQHGWLPPQTKATTSAKAPSGAPSPTGGRVPPGAMPMSGKVQPKPSPSSAPSSGLKPKSFLARYARPIEIGAGASVVIGAIALLAHAHGKGKRK